MGEVNLMPQQSSAQKSGDAKKVFFVYPHSVFQEALIQNLVDMEYEIYLLDDHLLIHPILCTHTEVVIFFNIDRVLSRQEWERFIRDVLARIDTKLIRLGILSYEYNNDVAALYLLELSLPAGYIQLKQSLEEATSIIKKTLIANEVQGKRKYVRCRLDGARTANFNFKLDEQLIAGSIVDISSSGVAVILNSKIELATYTHLEDIQLNLGGKRILVSGVVMGHRSVTSQSNRMGELSYIIVFNKTVNRELRGWIRKFVHLQLQKQLYRSLGR